jgi:hypothetical protein
MQLVDGGWRPALAGGVEWVLVDGEVVAVDAAERVHLIPSPGALLWQLIDGSVSVDELALDVADVFGVDLETARADVRRFATDMITRGLVTNGEPPADPGPP